MPRRILDARPLGLAALIALLTAACVSAATPIKVYLMAGQSNCPGYQANPTPFPDTLAQPQPNIRICGICGCGDNGKVVGDGCSGNGYSSTHGWTTLRPNWFSRNLNGSNISFGHNMQKARPSDSMVIIIAGEISNLAGNWLPPSSAGGPGCMFPLLMKGIRRQIGYLGANYECQFAGMCWMQGELDAVNGTAGSYKTNLTNFIKDIRDSLKVPNLPFVIGMISTVHNWGDNAGVRAAETQVAASVPYTGIVDTKTFDIADDGHYTIAGQVQLGDGFAREMLRLLNASTGVRSRAVENDRIPIRMKGGRLVVDRLSTVVISDVNGRTLRSASVGCGSTIDLREMGTGAYFVSVKRGRECTVSKVIAGR